MLLQTILGLLLGAQAKGSLGFDPHSGIAESVSRYAFSSMTICQMVSKVVVRIYIPTSFMKRFCFSAFSPILDINRLNFFFFANLVGTKCYDILSLIYISQVTGNIKSLFLCLSSIHVSCPMTLNVETCDYIYLFKYLFIYLLKRAYSISFLICKGSPTLPPKHTNTTSE